MSLTVLTLEQKAFAEEHHNLIYGFLHCNKLSNDEFYDVIVLGYLRAVQEYCECPEIRDQYKFSTIAWRKMKDDMRLYYQKQTRRKHRARIVSLNALKYSRESLILAETASEQDRLMEEFDAELLLEEIKALISEEQAEMLLMAANGYTTREIAASCNLAIDEIEDLIKNARESIRGTYFA